MGEETPNFKQTEFSSDVATLKRIDELICTLHRIYLTRPNNLGCFWGSAYIRILHRLYTEGRAKFDSEERKKCTEFQANIINVYNEGLKIVRSQYNNPNERIPCDMDDRTEIELRLLQVDVAIDYELYLMEILDKHNMLMKNR